MVNAKGMWYMHIVVGTGLYVFFPEAFGIYIISLVMNIGNRRQRNILNIYIKNSIIFRTMTSVLL